MLVKLDLLPNDKEVSLEIEIEGIKLISETSAKEIALSFYDDVAYEYAIRQLSKEEIKFTHTHGIIWFNKNSRISMSVHDNDYED